MNEDGLGLRGGLAWIIDGATGLSTEQLTSGGSDAAWLAETVGHELLGLANSSDPTSGLLERLQRRVGEAFDRVTAHLPGHHDSHVPSACLGLLRIGSRPDGSRHLEGRFLGDVVALVPTDTGVIRWTDERAKPFERKTLAALGGKRHDAGRLPDAVRRQILENRSMLNRPDGYWVVSPRRAWAGHELVFELPLATSRPIVLATDGFMRLVDVFGAYTDGTLHAALAAGRGGILMEELRALERDDRLSGLPPRVKVHDDATVLVVAAEPCG